MSARRVHDVAKHPSRKTIDHHHARPARYEDATGARFGGQLVSASVAANVPLVDLEVLRAPDAQRGKAGSDEESTRGT